MIRYFALLMILCCIFPDAMHAQELTVKSMTALPMDLSASQYERKDLNGQPCALVKVQLATMGARFEGNVIGSADYKTNEYWVYMTEGSYMLSVKHPNFVTLSVNFRDYGINGVQGKVTYRLTLLMPQAATPQQTQKLTINYSPANAIVLVDSKTYTGNGHVELTLPVGSHDYQIVAAGYDPAEGSVKLNANSPRTITENLTTSPSVQAQHQVSVQQQTPVQQSIQYSSPNAVETITVKGVSFNMVRVDGGTFTMGATSEQGTEADSDEKPAHQVTLSTYSIGETEVTQALWKAVMGKKPSRFKGDNLPVEQVSWDDCQTFIQKLNQLTGRRFRLPTEAEWEYAARGGNKSLGYKYSGSNNIVDVAWYGKNSNSRTHDVKTKQANELGLYDMSGNVWEWCQDLEGSYSSGSQTNPTGATSGAGRVDRGGGWEDNPRDCRSSKRFYIAPESVDYSLGLRLALK